MCPPVVSCADPVSNWEVTPPLTITNVAPAPSIWVTEGATDGAPPCGNVNGRDNGVPVTSLKKLSVACAALAPVLTSTKVVCQPSPPEARCAMLPPLVPTLAKAGIVVSALLGGVKRKPRTLIRPPDGVSNSMVPRLFAVKGNPETGSDNTNAV